MTDAPRVTLGIATYNRDTYLGEAVRSSLQQDYDDFEVLVVVDGSTNAAITRVLHECSHPRLRVIRHERNLGIAAAYNTFVSEGRGELIAMLGDDDACLPDRLRRQVAIFDEHPDTGVVHGDALVIDGQGQVVGPWNSADFTPAQLVQAFYCSHNHLVDPTRMVHRRVYEKVGGYDGSYPIAQDFHFWLRAARHFRFRHCAGGPLVRVRRHGENTSGDDAAARAREVADVERALEQALALYPLRELVPELDWSLLQPREAERQALARLAERLEQRLLALPGLARRLRMRAAALPAAAGGDLESGADRPGAADALTAAASRSRGGRRPRLLITAFGWNDPGGGTTVPRLAAKELARRGWDVTVFHAAVAPSPSGQPYELSTWSEDGVTLVGVHNRPSVLFDIGNPLRELDDPPIRAAFAGVLNRVAPDVVHFHNLHNLGASLIDVAASSGVPAYFTTHNYWLICPRAYLLTGGGAMCAGPGDHGGDCASCAGSRDVDGHRRRLAEIRARAHRGLSAILAVSDAVRETLLANGYSPELVDVVRQAMPHEGEIWEQVGRERQPGRAGEQLTVAFLGSAYPHKGPQLLVQAAQRSRARLRVLIHGEVPAPFAEQLRALDRRNVVQLTGSFSPSELGSLLRGVDAAALPSMWWDCAPLAAAECRAARVPLLVPRLGGLPETIRDGIDGLAFDGLDADDLARCLDRLALEQGLLERLQGAIGPPRSFADYVDELEAYYRGGRPSQVAREGAVCAPAPQGPGGAQSAMGDASQREPAVRWKGDHGLALSLSIINGQVTRRLPGRVERVTRDGAPVAGEAPLPHGAQIEVRHQWPPDLSPPASGRLALIQPWEFGAVPASWVEAMGRDVDELWVPSEFVRAMYVAGGLDPDRVFTIPNGVDLDVFRPDGEHHPLPEVTGGVRFLFVGGLIWRKGHDLLLSAWRSAFAGRDDVTLVVKDVGANGVYRNGERDEILEYARSQAIPRVVVLSQELSERELASLYRACDVLVHPYRGEGFAMPVLEAMACGLPCIVTDGGPTDEFCPPHAAWRIASSRAHFPSDRVDTLATVGRPWVLEPDVADLARLLLAAAADPDERARRGEAAAAAAQGLSWDAVAGLYAQRLRELAQRPVLLGAPRVREPFPFTDDAHPRVLATPAWRGSDELGQLLAQWCAATSPADRACLYLLADPTVDGDPAQLEAAVLDAAAAAGADLEDCADINVLMEPLTGDRDTRLHAAVDAYVPLHAACTGHERLAREAGNRIVALAGGALAALLGPLADAA